MTENSIHDLEERYLALKNRSTTNEWRDVGFLEQKVDTLMDQDTPLAFRIMQRLKNLDPSPERIAKLAKLKEKLTQSSPEFLTASSTHSTNSDNKPSVFMSLSKKMGFETTSLTGDILRKPIVVVVLVPFLIFAFYQIVWASDRYESRTQLIVKQPDGMSTLDPSMALLSGFGVSSGGNDNELLKAHILSNDMMEYLQKEVDLKEHFEDSAYDFFSRLSGSASREDKLEYYQSLVKVENDDVSGVMKILVQGFEPDFTERLAQKIVARAEWYINEIGHNLAKEQLSFVHKEHAIIEKKLQSAKKQLLAFQRQHNLLDPEAEGMALQQISYSLEGEIAVKKAQLRTIQSGMSDNAPLVLQAQAELNSLVKQLESERKRLTHKPSDATDAGNLSVGEILGKFSDLKIDIELALQAYTSSQISLEKSRIEAYRQLKYLVVVESPTLPEEARYPDVVYNLSLFLAVALMLFIIGKIILATVEELR
ncbi:MAG: capsular polysaccharide transport system permease protein [Glaciecola sp.]|jgi:capsular polysaccharide transport system permease protein